MLLDKEITSGQIRRTFEGREAPGGEIEVNGGRSDRAMSEEHLDGAQIITGIKAMGSKTMPEGMGSDPPIRRKRLS